MRYQAGNVQYFSNGWNGVFMVNCRNPRDMERIKKKEKKTERETRDINDAEILTKILSV